MITVFIWDYDHANIITELLTVNNDCVLSTRWYPQDSQIQMQGNIFMQLAGRSM